MTRMHFLTALVAGVVLAGCAPSLPKNPPITEARWLDQNWSDDERFWFHHASQGTSTLPVPYDWFVALEQPNLSLFGDPGLLKDSDYLRRFGFIPSPRSLDADKATLREYGYGGGYGDGRRRSEIRIQGISTTARRSREIRMVCRWGSRERPATRIR